MVSCRFEFNIPMSDTDHKNEGEISPAPPRALTPAAKRALAEAEARRKATVPEEMPAEVGGRGGADPARYGDWEINGRAIDF
jgi:hypothetical protein